MILPLIRLSLYLEMRTKNFEKAFLKATFGFSGGGECSAPALRSVTTVLKDDYTVKLTDAQFLPAFYLSVAGRIISTQPLSLIILLFTFIYLLPSEHSERSDIFP